MAAKPNAVLVCVEFSDLLAITLPRNAHHFNHITVITDFSDNATERVVASVPNAGIHKTNDFYQHGAAFNKGAAIESALNWSIQCEGWLCIMDADILLPPHANLSGAIPGKLYTPRRRILADPSRWREWVDSDWCELPLNRDEEWAGYFQLFHAGDAALVEREHWYDPGYSHAGVSDSLFAEYWPRANRARPPFEVLHLGEDGKNWCGRCTPRVDGSLHPQADARAAALQRFLTLREINGNLGAERIKSQEAAK